MPAILLFLPCSFPLASVTVVIMAMSHGDEFKLTADRPQKGERIFRLDLLLRIASLTSFRLTFAQDVQQGSCNMGTAAVRQHFTLLAAMAGRRTEAEHEHKHQQQC